MKLLNTYKLYYMVYWSPKIHKKTLTETQKQLKTYFFIYNEIINKVVRYLKRKIEQSSSTGLMAVNPIYLVFIY